MDLASSMARVKDIVALRVCLVWIQKWRNTGVSRCA